MPLRAVGLGCVRSLGAALAGAIFHVVYLRSEEKMGRVYALWHIALMQNVQALRDGRNVECVAHPVCGHFPSVSEEAVAK